MRSRRRSRVGESGAWLAALLAWLLSACAGSGGETAIAEPALQAFQDEVYPVLLRDCAFPACHGDTARFFRMYGPGRTRLDPLVSAPLDPATDAEILASYERARSNIDLDHPLDSTLLQKPLDPSAGGASHLGADDFFRDVYANAEAPGFLVLRAWVERAVQEPTTPIAPGASP